MQNTIFTGDNLYILQGLDSESVDLVYLDPPFNTKRVYSGADGSKAAEAAFKDMWSWDDVDEARLEWLFDKFPKLASYIDSVGDLHGKPMKAYICWMALRVIELHRVLKPTGSMYLHCDPTASHYLKLLCDAVFGKKNMQNEIVWAYRTGGATTARFSKKHDLIYFYSKGESYKFRPTKEKAYTKAKGRKAGVVNYGAGKAEFFEDDDGVYNLVNSRDVWEISYINSQSKERLGYPTQKPMELLKKIMGSAVDAGDVVLDPFYGSGTTLQAAHEAGCSWIGINVEEHAPNYVIDRFTDNGLDAESFIIRSDVPKRTDLTYTEPTGKEVRPHLFKEQGGCCQGCHQKFEIQHFEVDHVIPRSKGGGNYIENYQLLCSSCNRIKGARPMEYLMTKIRLREQAKRKISFGQ